MDKIMVTRRFFIKIGVRYVVLSVVGGLALYLGFRDKSQSAPNNCNITNGCQQCPKIQNCTSKQTKSNKEQSVQQQTGSK